MVPIEARILWDGLSVHDPRSGFRRIMSEETITNQRIMRREK